MASSKFLTDINSHNSMDCNNPFMHHSNHMDNINNSKHNNRSCNKDSMRITFNNHDRHHSLDLSTPTVTLLTLTPGLCSLLVNTAGGIWT